MEFSKEHMQAFLLSHARVVETEPEKAVRWVWTFHLHEGVEWSSKQLHCALRYWSTPKVTERLVVTPTEGTATLEIEGNQAITHYYHHESPALVPGEACTWKRTRVLVSEMMPDELPVQVKSSVVEDVQVAAPGLEGWQEQLKYYRLEKEYEVDHGAVRLRARFHRQSQDRFARMADSGVSTSPVSIHFEMECKKGSADEDLLMAAVEYIQMILDTSLLLSRTEQEAVLEEYDALVSSMVKKHMHRGRQDRKEDEEGVSAAAHHFLAPKPITMEQIHLTPPGPLSYGITSIWKGYAVTDKADGERMLFYISQEGRGYLINNTFDVFDTGLQATSKAICGSLLDGEFVTVDVRRDMSKHDLFAVFDVYFYGGKSVMDLPLVHATGRDRVTAMHQIVEKKMWEREEAQVEVRVKEHIAADGDAMKEACRALLYGAHDLPYEVDGLIFTPAELSVFGYYPGVPVAIPENVRWDKVLKWKPGEQNTIDFLVEEVRNYVDPTTRTPFRSFRLYTGYNAAQWEHIGVQEGVRLRYDRDFARSRRVAGNTYRAKAFDPTLYFEHGIDTADVSLNGKQEAVCKDGSVIVSKCIIEFAYKADPTVPVSQRWVPLRVREDKTRIYERTKKLSKTANDRSVAFNIWRSIHAPVTREMITGVEPVPATSLPETLEERLLGTDDVYYARQIPRDKMLSVHMLDFHNQGVKLMLYRKARKKDALLELACGKAGDLARWRDVGFRFVMGVDFVKDNITNPHDGTYARMIRQNHVLQRSDASMTPQVYSDYVFVVGDCAKPLDTGEAAEGLDDESKKMLVMLYHRGQTTASYHRHIAGRASQGFSMVSCMFAVHYFFRNEDMLRGFFANVSQNLRKGGIFIATFMDGDAVHALLDASGAEGKVEGRKLDGKVPVWALLRRYLSYGDTPEDYYGKMVEVYLENTNRLIPEYIVHLDTLVERAKEAGLELEETHMFSATFAELYDAMQKDPSLRVGRMDRRAMQALSMDEVQTRFSFLNRWVVFRKT